MSYKATEIHARDLEHFRSLEKRLAEDFAGSARILENIPEAPWLLIETTPLDRAQKKKLRELGYEVSDLTVMGSGGGGSSTGTRETLPAPVAFLMGLIIGS